MPKIVDNEQRRLAISEATAGLIASGGMEAVTIREIARASGYTKGVIGHYFDNKEALIDGALAWVNLRYETRVAEATDNQAGLNALRHRITATIPSNRNTRDEWKVRLVFWGLAAIKPALREQQKKRFSLAVERFEQDLREAAAAGDLRGDINVPVSARHLVNMITGISTAALHNPSLYSKDVIAAEVDFLVRDFLQ